jgi:hypothetical protein
MSGFVNRIAINSRFTVLDNGRSSPESPSSSICLTKSIFISSELLSCASSLDGWTYTRSRIVGSEDVNLLDFCIGGISADLFGKC